MSASKQRSWKASDYLGLTSGVEVSLRSARPPPTTGSTGLSEIEVVRGSNFADEIDGDKFGNPLQGKAGDDEIDGGEGNDVLAGGAGADTFDFDASVRSKFSPATNSGFDRITDFDRGGRPDRPDRPQGRDRLRRPAGRRRASSGPTRTCGSGSIPSCWRTSRWPSCPPTCSCSDRSAIKVGAWPIAGPHARRGLRCCASPRSRLPSVVSGTQLTKRQATGCSGT